MRMSSPLSSPAKSSTPARCFDRSDSTKSGSIAVNTAGRHRCSSILALHVVSKVPSKGTGEPT
jgi:hypothetical protein